MSPARRALTALAVGVGVGAVVLVKVLYRFTAEDSWIVLRYARNLRTRGEFVFNPGEKINALSSPLHGLLLAATRLVTGHAETADKLLGLACLAGSGLVIALALRASRSTRLVVAALVLTSPYVVLWAVGGLETPLLLLVLTGLTVAAHRWYPDELSATHVRTLLVLASLAILTRFDAVLYVLPLLVALWNRHRDRRPDIIRAGLPALVILVGWMAFQLAYFRDPLPTSFYTKRPGLTAHIFWVNVRYELQFAVLSGLVVLALLAASGLRRSRAHPALGRDHLRRVAWVYWGVGLVLAYGLTMAATTHMMFSYRIFLPFLPAVGVALADLIDRAPTQWGWAVAAAALMVANGGQALLVTRSSLNPGLVGEYRHEGALDYRDDFIATLRLNAVDIEQHWQRVGTSTQRSPRVETFAAGILPYYLRDSYVFEDLVSYRHRCHASTLASADYVHLITPRHGTVREQLGTLVASLTLVSDRRIPFDGSSQRLLVFFNPHPEPNPLPSDVFGACKSG